MRSFCLGLREDPTEAGVGVKTIFPVFVRDAGMFAQVRLRQSKRGTRHEAEGRAR